MIARPALAALTLALALPAAAPAEDLAPPAPLTDFQWAVKTSGRILLVPVEGRLYPAKRTGEALVETLPLQVPVALYADERALSVALPRIRSPREVGPEAWILELREGEGEDARWVPAAKFLFDDAFFYVQRSPGRYDAVPLGAVRLVPRD